ncbi:MAG: N-6 DNA methylase [Syntrophomonadaceae bacterium]|nr:N-6 DNA methylase [Syntrophomonadaceae bacterium]
MSKALDTLYKDLDFQSGSLLTASDKPTSEISIDDWLEKGEWLAAAKRAGAEKVFFVENNPVAVFAECGADHLEKERVFNRIWCLGRPRLLFLASPGEISVLDLAQKPINLSEPEENRSEEQRLVKSLKTLYQIEKVAQVLQQFHRDNIESGRIFGEIRFGDVKNRADKALIRDLKIVRRELIQAGLSGQKIKFAHSLIGRSIFIRYLEDRGILTQEYFLKIARQNSEWMGLLTNQLPRIGYDAIFEYQASYPRVLEHKAFTYALFKALAQDFNGDMFPGVDEEEQVVTQKHLSLIQDLLYGDVGVQKQLFFYSYRFDIVPLDLISSIYEEFYDPSTSDDEKQNKARQDGAYYTPAVLAEFVISRVLTFKELQMTPRVLDPACGSGIFLVESFRRIVRYEWHKNQNRPNFDTLKQILATQIAGIEVNEEAARITAFSLYLAMLHYLDPPAITEQIKQGNKLPNLLASEVKSKNHLNCVWVGNAFNTAAIESNPLWASSFGQHCADIIVSNPPWGAPGKKADDATKARERVMLEWCHINKKPVGDKEPSQAFLWRALDFLKDGGKAVVLVSAGVLFKHSTTTRAFREQWMDRVRLLEVCNFTHVRKFFFKGAVSPFVIICFVKDKQNDFSVKYWSAKQVIALKETQAVLLSKYDIHMLRDEQLASSELWKSYWFGRLADRQFIRWLQSKNQLRKYVDCNNSGRGYELASRAFEAERLQSFESLVKIESRYETPVFTSPPERVHRFGAQGAYRGLRVIVNEGISENTQPQGIIVAQFSDIPFCYYRSVYGLKLSEQEEWGHKLLLGIIWSSLARYYFFMTSANWGLWHHKLLLDELLQLPIIFNKESPISRKIINIVDKLRNYHPQEQDLLNPVGVSEAEIEAQRRIWEKELDEAVFELYNLNEEQKDLIRDCCEVTLPFFYKPFNSVGIMPAVQDNDLSWIEKYVQIFARRWNAYLEDDMEMRAEVHVGAHGNMVAVEFFPADKADPWNLHPKNDSWQYVLEQIGKALLKPMETSRILVDGIVHVVSDESVIVIKRNERRFWTRSLAREDADATLCKRMIESGSEDGGKG